MSEQAWWWSLTKGDVEYGPGTANSERLGPYATEGEARSALDRARQRTEQMDEQDDAWRS